MENRKKGDDVGEHQGNTLRRRCDKFRYFVFFARDMNRQPWNIDPGSHYNDMDTVKKILVDARGERKLSSRRDHEGIE